MELVRQSLLTILLNPSDPKENADHGFENTSQRRVSTSTNHENILDVVCDSVRL